MKYKRIYIGIVTLSAIISTSNMYSSATASHGTPPAAYRPLIVSASQPFVELTDREDANIPRRGAPEGRFYVLHKDEKTNKISAREIIIQRYAGSGVWENPWFRPALGFRCIASPINSSYTVDPLVEQYREFLMEKFTRKYDRSFADRFTTLFFYKDTENTHPAVGKKLQANQEPVDSTSPRLIVTLKQLKPETDSQRTINSTQQDPLFECTNIFIDPTVTLQDLQTQINPHIQQDGDTFYVQDAEGVAKEYTIFKKWITKSEAQ